MPWPVVRVERSYRFRATHSLPKAISNNAKSRHWHDYKITLVFEHEINPADGWAMDFDELDKKVQGLFEFLHLKNLNEIMEVPPTSEALACTILNTLQGFITAVEVSEADKVSATVTRKQLRDWHYQFDVPHGGGF